jgi:hypothetical protein
MLSKEGVSTPAVPIKAKLVAPPFYVLDTNATDKVLRFNYSSVSVSDNIYVQHAGVENLEAAIEAIRVSISAEGGELNVKMRVGQICTEYHNNLLIRSSYFIAQSCLRNRRSGTCCAYGQGWERKYPSGWG